jgi:hypothetical protein
MLKISVNRNQFVANKLGSLKGETVLDLGCRDQILKKYLIGEYNYIGADVVKPLNKNKSKILLCDLEKGIPKLKKKIDIIVALDVLEHLDNAHLVRDQMLKLSKKKIIIALPNMSYYKFRLNFMFKGIVSGKYPFDSFKPIDRHKWLPNYYNINNFFKDIDHNWKVTAFNFICQRRFNFLSFLFDKILSHFFPNLFVYERIYLIEKI